MGEFVSRVMTQDAAFLTCDSTQNSNLMNSDSTRLSDMSTAQSATHRAMSVHSNEVTHHMSHNTLFLVDDHLRLVV